MLGFFKKADKGVELIQLVFCGVIMLAIMWLTFFMVFFRYVLNNSIVWAEEVLRYLMMWAVLVGAGLAARDDQHVCMDVLQTSLKRWPKVRAIHYIITRLIVFVFMIYLWGPTMDLIVKAGNSTATSLTWLHKSVIYSAFLCGIVSVNLSLLGQVPRKVCSILKGVEDDEMILDAQAKAAEYDRMLEENKQESEAPEDCGDRLDDGGGGQ